MKDKREIVYISNILNKKQKLETGQKRTAVTLQYGIAEKAAKHIYNMRKGSYTTPVTE